MKKILIITAGLMVLVTFNRAIKGCQQAPQVEKLRTWIQAAKPVEKSATESNYDPSKVSKEKIQTLELTIKDSARDREIPVLVYLPQQSKAAEVVVYSHGLGGSRETAPFLGKHWAARGYVAVFMQHPGSDESIWKDLPPKKRFRALKQAANAENFLLRVADVPVVIDHLEKWNRQANHSLYGRMNTKKIGMTGHSFGAVTAQNVSGQTSFGKTLYLDDRITACVAMSPSSPRMGSSDKAFGKVSLPWLCMTGTHDKAMIGGAVVEDRLAVYPALPAKDKYELVLFEAEHSAFTESKLPFDRLKRNPNHHSAILATSTAFWDAYLRDDAEAKQWLTTDAVRSVLETKDRWQYK